MNEASAPRLAMGIPFMGRRRELMPGGHSCVDIQDLRAGCQVFYTAASGSCHAFTSCGRGVTNGAVSTFPARSKVSPPIPHGPENPPCLMCTRCCWKKGVDAGLRKKDWEREAGRGWRGRPQTCGRPGSSLRPSRFPLRRALDPCDELDPSAALRLLLRSRA